jgi:Predicted nucleotidyltransferase
MRDIITAKLAEIEKYENVRIIYAVESGSRAWGFESPDSDYDVRFIYVRLKEFYLKLEQTRDVIEWQLDDVLDINGWDLQKTLRLLRKSNPTVFEWDQSPVVYKITPEWNLVRSKINECFSMKAVLYHYINIARAQYNDYLTNDMVRLKKYFYAVRPILAAEWVLDKKCPPPIQFAELVEAKLPPELSSIVENLLEQKSKSPELGEAKRVDILSEYIRNSVDLLTTAAGNLPNDSVSDWSTLNELFLSIV